MSGEVKLDDPAPKIRWCRKGHVELETKFHCIDSLRTSKNPNGCSSYCITCDKQAMKDRCFQKKLQVFEHYGRICACCGESFIEFLALDHIEGGGRKQRDELKLWGDKIYWWIVKHCFPPEFRVLCHNCNMSIGFFGYCPHQNVQNPES